MAHAKDAKQMKQERGKVRASLFLSTDLNRRLKLAADREAERTGERMSLSTYAARILDKAVPAR